MFAKLKEKTADERTRAAVVEAASAGTKDDVAAPKVRVEIQKNVFLVPGFFGVWAPDEVLNQSHIFQRKGATVQLAR
jgi:hypothetical protein